MSDVYNNALTRLGQGEVDWDNDTFHCLLLTFAAGPTFDPTQIYVQDLLDEPNNVEPTDPSYSRFTLPDAFMSHAYNNAEERTEFYLSTDLDFGALDNETIGAAVIYEMATNDEDSELMFYLTSPKFPLTADGTGFDLTPGGSIIFTIGRA